MTGTQIVRYKVALATLVIWAAASIHANATIAWESVGEPVEGNSWSHQFAAHGRQSTRFDQITVSISNSYGFESNAMRDFTEGTNGETLASWSLSNQTSSSATAKGDAQEWVGWTFHFTGDKPADGSPPLTLTLTAYSNGLEVDSAIADYKPDEKGNWIWQIKGKSAEPAPVPEPSTILAGALLLLPLSAAVIRAVRKDRGGLGRRSRTAGRGLQGHS